MIFRYVYHDGAIYEGNWLNGQMHGKGRFSYPDSSVYFGYFKMGLKDGLGKLEFASGNSEIGKWEAGIFVMEQEIDIEDEDSE